MIQLTRRDLEQAYDQVASASRFARGHRAQGERIARHAIQGVEVLAGAAASGFIAGRYGAPHLMIGGTALPLDAAAGAGLHALAFFGLFGNYDEHVHNFANGVLAQYVARWGVGYGTHLREKAGLPRVAGTGRGSAPMTGAPAPAAMRGGRGPLTAAELAAIAAHAR